MAEKLIIDDEIKRLLAERKYHRSMAKRIEKTLVELSKKYDLIIDLTMTPRQIISMLEKKYGK